MRIERAKECDIPEINKLLLQVLTVHHEGRGDLFKGNTKKYTDEQLKTILKDDSRPVFVALADSGLVDTSASCGNPATSQEPAGVGGNSATSARKVLGYAFCVFSSILTTTF